MGEMALKDPNPIRTLIHDNGNGTYTVTLHQKDNGLPNFWGLFGNDYKPNPLGLVGPHAYMVTGVSSTPKGQFVTLQNPWGVGTSGGGPAVMTVPYSQLQPFLTNASVGKTH